MNWLTALLASPLLNGVSFVLGVLGLILAYVFYRRAQRGKEPAWDIDSVNLVRNITSSLEGLSLLYKGKEVPNITVSKVIFWNNGRSTIDRTDIAPADPVRIKAGPGVRLLHATVLAANSAPSQFGITHESIDESVLIDFEYLDDGQGAVVQVVHDGLRSSDIEVTGSIKGAARVARKAIARVGSPSMLRPRARRAVALAGSYLLLAFGLAGLALYLLSLASPREGSSDYGALLFLFVLVTIGALLNIAQWRQPCPRELEAFLGEWASTKAA